MDGNDTDLFREALQRSFPELSPDDIEIMMALQPEEEAILSDGSIARVFKEPTPEPRGFLAGLKAFFTQP